MRRLLLPLALMLSVTAHAELFDRGGGFIYDDVLDITWTQNAVMFQGGWYEATEWADALVLYDSVRDTSWDDWRLATTNVDGTSFVPRDCAVVTELECRNNELGYLYYYYGITVTSQAPFFGMTSHVSRRLYWTGDDGFPSGGIEQNFGFSFSDANVYVYFFPRFFAAWAVREGDVAQDFTAVIDVVQPPLIHPQHDGGDGGGLNDSIEVVVLGASTAVGDPADLDTAAIDPSTLRFGASASGGAIAPGSVPLFNLDHDNDGIDDASFEFLTGDTGIGCSTTEVTLIGELSTGESFLATDSIETDCEATCH